MYDTYSDANRVITESRKVTYSCEPKVENGDPVYWKVRRRCHQAYKYVGLTEAAAKSGAEELSRNFTRRYANWTAKMVNGDLQVSQTYELQQTSCAQAHNSGGSMWQIDVTIDDTDLIISDHDLATVDEIEQYFALAESRDVLGQKIAITAAKWVSSEGRIYVDFTQNITNFDTNNVFVYIVTSSGESSATVVNVTNNSLQIIANGNREFYIRYPSDPNAIESKHFKTTNFPQPVVTVQSTKQYMAYMPPAEDRLIYAGPSLEIRVQSDTPLDASFVSVFVGGKSADVLQVNAVGSGVYQIIADPNVRYGAFPALSSSFQIRLRFNSLIPLDVIYDFTPTSYMNITSATWAGSYLTVKFTSDLNLTQVTNYIRTINVRGSTYGESGGGVTSVQLVGNEYTLKANVGQWRETVGGYYCAFVRASMPTGEDIVNYCVGASKSVREMIITSAVRQPDEVHPTINVNFTHSGISDFNNQYVTAFSKASAEGATWQNLPIFDRSGNLIVTETIATGSSIMLRYEEPSGDFVESNVITPIGD